MLSSDTKWKGSIKMILTSGIMDLSEIDLNEEQIESTVCSYCDEEIAVGDPYVKIDGFEVACSIDCLAKMHFQYKEGYWGDGIGVDDND